MSENTLKLIQEHDARWVDLRFTDTQGKEQHVTVPVREIDEAFFNADSDNKFIISFDITSCAKRLLNSGDRISATINIAEGKGSVTWNRSEVAIFISERN